MSPDQYTKEILKTVVNKLSQIVGRLDQLVGIADRPRQDNKHGASPKGAPTQEDYAVIGKAFFFQQIHPAETLHKNPQKKWHQTLQGWKTLFELIAIPFAVGYAVVTYYQWRDAKKNFVADERPYVWHDTLQGDESVPRLSGVRVYWTNYGKSPALRFSSTGHVFCGKDALSEAYQYLNKVAVDKSWGNNNSVIVPGINQGLPTANRAYDTFVTDALDPGKKQACAGTNPSLPKVFVGAWQYYDPAGHSYRGEFCNGVHLGQKRGYDSSGNCDEHNSM